MSTLEVESEVIDSSRFNSRSMIQKLARDKQRANKLYRTPVTPPLEKLWDLESSFTLDCVAISNISLDYSRSNPKVGSAIPPYNSFNDKSVSSYMKFEGLTDLLKRTNLVGINFFNKNLLLSTKLFNKNLKYDHPESIAGKYNDKFFSEGPAYQYLSARNRYGNGHSKEQVEGHRRYMGNQQRVMTSYNNMFGFRRNIPKLRVEPPSTFSIDPRIYDRIRKTYLPHFKEPELLDQFTNLHVIGYPFHDNESHHYHPNVTYIITVKVSSKSPESYDGNIGINLIAKNFDTGFIKLDNNIFNINSPENKNYNSNDGKLFKRGQTTVFQFEDQDIRTVSAILLMKDIRGEELIFLEYVQVDIVRSDETQSFRFPLNNWLRSAKQSPKVEELKKRFGKRNSIVLFPYEKPKYEYAIKVSPPILKNTEYKFELFYEIKKLNASTEYQIELISGVPEHGKLSISLSGLLGDTEPININRRTKSSDPDNQRVFKLKNKDIGDIKQAVVTYHDRNISRDHYFKGFILTTLEGQIFKFEADEELKPRREKLIIPTAEVNNQSEAMPSADGVLFCKLVGKSESTSLFELKNFKENKNGQFVFTKNDVNIGNIQNLKIKFQSELDKYCQIKNIKITSNKGHDFSFSRTVLLRNRDETTLKDRNNNKHSTAEAFDKNNVYVQIIGDKKKTEVFKLMAPSPGNDNDDFDLFYTTDQDLGKITNFFIRNSDENNEKNDHKFHVDYIEVVDPRDNSYKFIMDMSLQAGEKVTLPRKLKDAESENSKALIDYKQDLVSTEVTKSELKKSPSSGRLKKKHNVSINEPVKNHEDEE